jgi:hypothetical protein
MSETTPKELTLCAPDVAPAGREAGLVHHSDRGMSMFESAPRGGAGSIALGELSGIVLRRSSLRIVRDLGASPLPLPGRICHLV